MRSEASVVTAVSIVEAVRQACMLNHVLMSATPMDCNMPRISQARKLECVAISSSRGSTDPGIKPKSPVFPALQVYTPPLRHLGSLSICGEGKGNPET